MKLYRRTKVPKMTKKARMNHFRYSSSGAAQVFCSPARETSAWIGLVPPCTRGSFCLLREGLSASSYERSFVTTKQHQNANVRQMVNENLAFSSPDGQNITYVRPKWVVYGGHYPKVEEVEVFEALSPKY